MGACVCGDGKGRHSDPIAVTDRNWVPKTRATRLRGTTQGEAENRENDQGSANSMSSGAPSARSTAVSVPACVSEMSHECSETVQSNRGAVRRRIRPAAINIWKRATSCPRSLPAAGRPPGVLTVGRGAMRHFWRNFVNTNAGRSAARLPPSSAAARATAHLMIAACKSPGVPSQWRSESLGPDLPSSSYTAIPSMAPCGRESRGSFPTVIGS